jgi:succinate-acetate transporter protein
VGTIDERHERAAAGVYHGDGEAWLDGFARPRVVLQPVAAPSILGLFGFAGATFVVAAHMAGWYGNSTTALVLAPFAAFFGGLAQFLAGMWAYRARDAVATAMHGMWGAFWLAYGLLFLLVATGNVHTGRTFDTAFGMWFVPLAAITLSGAAGVLLEGNLAVTAVLGTLAVGAVLAAIGLMRGTVGIQHAAGWVFVVAAVLAWYTATAMMLKAAAGRTVLPLFKIERPASVPAEPSTRPIQLEWAEPGVKRGQ